MKKHEIRAKDSSKNSIKVQDSTKEPKLLSKNWLLNKKETYTLKPRKSFHHLLGFHFHLKNDENGFTLFLGGTKWVKQKMTI